MLDEELRKHRRILETAINKVLAESPEINEAIRQIREDGYDAFLIVEATVGFNKRADSASGTELHLTRQDERFLKSFKISPR